MNISIIIPTYNEENYLGRTLESLKNIDSAGHNIELIVVDGESKDDTVSIARNFKAKVLKESHRCISYARQKGLENASGEIVLYTDADTLVPVNWVKNHIKALKEADTVMTFGSYRVPDGYFPYFHWTNYVQPKLVGLIKLLTGIPLACGQNIAFWRKDAMTVGGFDDELEMLEDFDLAIRMKKQGKVKYLPKLIVMSSGRRSGEGWGMFTRAGKDMFKYFVFGKKKFRKYPGYR